MVLVMPDYFMLFIVFFRKLSEHKLSQCYNKNARTLSMMWPSKLVCYRLSHQELANAKHTSTHPVQTLSGKYLLPVQSWMRVLANSSRALLYCTRLSGTSCRLLQLLPKRARRLIDFSRAGAACTLTSAGCRRGADSSTL